MCVHFVHQRKIIHRNEEIMRLHIDFCRLQEIPIVCSGRNFYSISRRTFLCFINFFHFRQSLLPKHRYVLIVFMHSTSSNLVRKFHDIQILKCHSLGALICSISCACALLIGNDCCVVSCCLLCWLIHISQFFFVQLVPSMSMLLQQHAFISRIFLLLLKLRTL